MSVPTPVHVLIIEDVVADTELIVAELRRAGFAPDWRRVETQAGYVDRLSPEIDVILADYRLPSFNAGRALQILKARDLDIPFIVVSGTIDEEVAVACMKEGASDYLFKDRLGRLGPAVARALEQRQLREAQRKAQADLRESEERYRLVTEHTHDAIVLVDLEDRYTFGNRRLEEMTGYRLEELIGRSVFMVLTPEGAQAALARRDALQAGRDHPFFYETEIVRKDGTRVWAEVSSTSVVENGKLIARLAVARDITERKRSENALRESEERTRRIIAHALDAVITIDLDGRITDWNAQAEAMFGWSADAVRGHVLAETIIPPAHRAAHERGLAHYRQTGEGPVLNRRIELTALRRDGTEFPIELAITPMRVAGATVFSAFLRDISERKRAEEALATSAERLSLLHEIDRAIIASTAPVALAEAVLPRLQQLLGAPRAIVNLFDLETGEAEWLAAIGRRRLRAGAGVRFPLALMGDVAALGRGELQVIETAALPRGPHTEALLASGIDFYMVVPMLAGGELIGAISFGGAPSEFAPEQISVAHEVAAQLAIALAQARLREGVKRQADRLGLLHEIDRAILASKTPAAMAGAILPRLRDLLGVSRAIVNLFDLEAGEVEWLAAAGRRRVRVGPGVRYSLQLAGDVDALRRGEPQLIDIDSLPPSPEVDELRASGVRSYVVMPMIAGGELIGSVSFGGTSNTFAPEQMSIAQEVAAQLAIAIAQARLRERVAEAERQYHQIFENSVEGIYRSTRAGGLLLVNPAMARIYGYDSPADLLASVTDIGQQLYVDPEERQAMLRLVDEHGAVSRFECRGKRKDGTLIWVSQSPRVVRDDQNEILYDEGVLEDITDRKQLEQELLHVQRMEGVGQLAGGIAHDFNNLLTVISGRSQLGLDRLPPEHPLRRDLDLIHKTATRAAMLTRQLLAFSRKQVLQPKVVDVIALVQSSTSLLRRLIGEDIELIFVPAADTGRIWADPGQFEQIIVNLAVNARDAMPEGGRLTIEAGNLTLGTDYATRHIDVTPGRYVVLAVTDSGVGMSPEVRARIFEPFFTTKDPGKGTGLGLATVYGIVKQSGGHIRVYSEPGAGTTFRIYLPRTDAPHAATIVPRDHALPRGQETVLLVEDEAEVRSLAREILEGLGYTILEAAAPADALLIADRHVGIIDLVLTDVIMPGMSGRTLAERIATERPEAKILFMSGYTDDAIVRHGVLEAGIQFIEKPFTPADLAIKVRQVMDQPS